MSQDIIASSQSITTEDKRKKLRTLLLQMAKTHRNETNPDTNRPLKTTQDLIPLSQNQKTIWLAHEMNPTSAAYNTAFALKFLQPVNTVKLEHVCRHLLARHTILRSVFSTQAGEPIQTFSDSVEFKLDLIDGNKWDEDKLSNQIRTLYVKPFRINTPPLVKGYLIEAKHYSVFLLVVHHLLYDGWSLWVMIEELEKLYLGETLPEPKYTYKDFIDSQRVFLDSDLGKQQISFWVDHLRNPPPLLELPSDFKRKDKNRFKGESLEFQFDNQKSIALRALARELKVTPYVLFLAIYSILLSRYSKMEDIVIGAPVAGRSDEKWFSTIGCFVNTLPIRHRTDPQGTFKDHVRKVKESVLQALRNQDVPLNSICEYLGVAPSSLFRVDFVLQKPINHKVAALLVPNDNCATEWANIPVVPVDVPQQEGQFDLTLEMVDCKNVFCGAFRYNSDLFTLSRIKQLSQLFETLVNSCIKNPCFTVADLNILTPKQISALLKIGGYGIDTPSSNYETVLDAFQRQVDQVPDNIAVSVPNRQLSYAELDQAANQMANYLSKSKLPQGSRVAVCMPRSMDLMITILGILKAGCCYVPINPELPIKRKKTLFNQGSFSLIIYDENDLDELESNIRIIDWQQFKTKLAHLSITPDDRLPKIEGSHLAYMIFTSGTTGQPKLVKLSHKGLLASFLRYHEEYQLHEGYCHLQMANSAFDVFTGDWARALGSGGELFICPKSIYMDPIELYNWIKTKNVKCAEFVPAVIRPLLTYLHSSRQSLEMFKILIVASDNWYGADYNKLKPLMEKDAKVINSYGLTEATIDSTYYVCKETSIEPSAPIPIGRPFKGVRISIRDNYHNLVPHGHIGEIYIGGDGLAVGYDDDQLTKAKFIHLNSGERLYKTGDLGFFDKNNQIQLVGRIDHQIKLNGNRVELGEIESILCSFGHVDEGKVIVHQNEDAEKRLIAFYSGDAKEADLMEFLRSHLPSYMMPQRSIKLDSLPLSANGKIESSVLSQLSLQCEPHGTTRPPQNKQERVLLKLLQSLLGNSTLSLSDNVFHFGLSSIKVMEVVSQAFQSGLGVSARDIFEGRTIEDISKLSRLLEPGLNEESLSPKLARKVLAYNPIQQWLFKYYRKNIWQNIVIDIKTPFDPISLEKSLNTVVQRHPIISSALTEHSFEIPDKPTPLNLYPLSNDNLDDAFSELKEKSSEYPTGVVSFGLANYHNVPKLIALANSLVLDSYSWRIVLKELNQSVKSTLPSMPEYEYTCWLDKFYEALDETAIQKQVDEKLPCLEQPAPAFQYEKQRYERLKFSIKNGYRMLEKYSQQQLSILITEAFTETLFTHFGFDRLIIDLEGNGRISPLIGSFSDAIGPMSYLYPLQLEKHDTDKLLKITDTYKYSWDQYLARVKGRGLTASKFGFNYLGDISREPSNKDDIFSINSTLTSHYSQHLKSTYWLFLECFFQFGTLEFHWYNNHPSLPLEIQPLQNTLESFLNDYKGHK